MERSGRELRRELESKIEELQTIRDELRVKAHLAGLELRDKLSELEDRLDTIETEMRESAEKFRDALADLGKSFRSLKDRHVGGHDESKSKAA